MLTPSLQFLLHNKKTTQQKGQDFLILGFRYKSAVNWVCSWLNNQIDGFMRLNGQKFGIQKKKKRERENNI